MRQPFPDFELVAQIAAFMQSVPLLWNQEELAAFHSSGRTHVEHRGTEEAPLSFEFQVLENELGSVNGYLHVVVSVCDSVRPKDVPGSSWNPLTSSFIWRKGGEIEMPLPWEIYRRTFAHVS